MKIAKSNDYHLTGQRPAAMSVKVDIRGLFRETRNFDKLLTCENILAESGFWARCSKCRLISSLEIEPSAGNNIAAIFCDILGTSTSMNCEV
jgi:hypothetical protein